MDEGMIRFGQLRVGDYVVVQTGPHIGLTGILYAKFYRDYQPSVAVVIVDDTKLAEANNNKQDEFTLPVAVLSVNDVRTMNE